MNGGCEVVIVGTALTDLQVCPVKKTIADATSCSVEHMVWTVGGDALNEATIITRMGHKVRLISCIGEDMAGSLILEHCEKNHIDAGWLKRNKTMATSINVGLVWEDGERTFILNKGGSIWTCTPEDIDLEAVSEGKILSFASIFNNPLLDASFLLSLFQRAKAQGMTICADTVTSKRGETLADIRQALGYVDYFFPNYDEARALVGRHDIDEIADVLLDLGVKNVILKVGARGCLVKNARERFIVPIYPNSNCIDTTGAGDNFASGFICGLLEGRSLYECAQLANCTASIAIEAVGATTGVQSRAQVEARYQDYMKILNP